MKIARLIITLDCNRKCHYCCNTPEMLASATHINDLSVFKDYDEICITGGEPMLYPEKVIDISNTLKRYNNNKIYLYTAHAIGLPLVINRGSIDGIHYTLHNSVSASDFAYVQALAHIEKGVSFRAYILPGHKDIILLDTSDWARLEIKPWIKDCPLSENETLFILE